MSYKGNKVWAAADSDNSLIAENGKVLIKYNLKQGYEYRVKLENLNPESEAVPSRKKTGTKKTRKNPAKKQEKDADLPDNCIKIYTDGASSGNPGFSGIGILFIYGEKRKEISKYIGPATSNIAELTAIKVALQELKRHDLPVRVFSDSNYAIGVLTKGWKPQKNKSLISDIKTLIERFSDLSFIKVKGHSGIKENEVADFLATSAIEKGQE